MSEPSAESLERARKFIDAHNPIVSHIAVPPLARIFDTIREEERERIVALCEQFSDCTPNDIATKIQGLWCGA